MSRLYESITAPIASSFPIAGRATFREEDRKGTRKAPIETTTRAALREVSLFGSLILLCALEFDLRVG